MVLYLYKKKVVWIVGLDLVCWMGKSVDFCGVLRYWVRYWDLVVKVSEMLNFTGFVGILFEWFNF